MPQAGTGRPSDASCRTEQDNRQAGAAGEKTGRDGIPVPTCEKARTRNLLRTLPFAEFPLGWRSDEGKVPLRVLSRAPRRRAGDYTWALWFPPRP